MTGPYLDRSVARQLTEISAPLVVRRVGGESSRFVLILIVAQFGTLVIAAYSIARQLRGLLRAPNWGFGLASSSLVGQELGADDEEAARTYAWDILRFSLSIFVITSATVALFSEPIARLFVQQPAAIAVTTPFVLVVAITLLGDSVDGVASGTLRAGGDTAWAMYGRLLGRFGALPVAYLGVVSPVGVLALYLAMLTESYVPAVVTFYRFKTQKWIEVSRRYRPDTTR